MTTYYAQNEGKFELDITTGGALTDYTSHVTAVSGMDFQSNTGQHHVVNGTAANTTVGGHMFTDITVTIKADPTAASLWRVVTAWRDAIEGGTTTTRTVRRSSPDSSTSGSQQRSAEVVLKSLSEPTHTGGSGELATVQAVLQVDGAATTATVA